MKVKTDNSIIYFFILIFLFKKKENDVKRIAIRYPPILSSLPVKLAILPEYSEKFPNKFFSKKNSIYISADVTIVSAIQEIKIIFSNFLFFKISEITKIYYINLKYKIPLDKD